MDIDSGHREAYKERNSNHVNTCSKFTYRRIGKMKLTFLGVVLLVVVVLSLAVTKTELVAPKTERKFVKFNIKDLPEHGIVLMPPSDPTLIKGRAVLIDPYSVLLKNTSTRAIVGYSIKWECSDGKAETSARNLSLDRILLHTLGVVFLYGEESERRLMLNRLEDVIKPNSTWLIANDYPPREINQEVNVELNEAAIAEVNAACPTMTVTLDGIFFDDGTFIGPDKTNFFANIKTQMDVRYEMFEAVRNELKLGKTPGEVFRGLEQIRDRERQDSGETIDELRSYYRNLFARDVLGRKEVWGTEKAIEQVHQLLSKPWVKLRKL